MQIKKLFGVNWPTRDEIRLLEKNLSVKDNLFLVFFSVLFIIGFGGIASRVNNNFLVSIPLHGGSHSEGVLGSPRTINPVFASSDADRDMTQLIYTGLMRFDDEGNVQKDLAEDYSISEDGLVYTFTLKKGLKFHDGKDLTTEDVLFTIKTVQNPLAKSPKRINWEGVSIEVIDERTISFVLEKPYGAFIENTTIGIIPKHIWEDIAVEDMSLYKTNLEPIGSGPYKFEKIKRDSNDIPREINLSSFDRYSQGEPYINSFTMKFYDNEQDLIKALRQGSVDAIHSVSGEEALSLEGNYEVTSIRLPRVFGMFFNQNKNSMFGDKAVTEAIEKAIDKNELVNIALSGYGVPVYGPRPIDTEGEAGTIEEANEILEKAGYVAGDDGTRTKKTKEKEIKLSFAISTGDIDELKKSAEYIRDRLSLLGISVEIRVFDIGDLNQNVIKPRDYEALLFGEVIQSDYDLYSFWHSSERNDPGLNVSLYTNSKVDKSLEEIIKTVDTEKVKELSDSIKETIVSERPAIFLYSPNLIYVRSRGGEVKSQINRVRDASSRFSSVSKWYIEQEKVWNIFVK